MRQAVRSMKLRNDELKQRSSRIHSNRTLLQLKLHTEIVLAQRLFTNLIALLLCETHRHLVVLS